MSIFSVVAPKFEAFLETSKNSSAIVPGRVGDPQNTRFIPRNFLIEERIDSERAGHYAATLPSYTISTFEKWNEAHNRYLSERILITPPAIHDYRSVNTEDITVCPDTFRSSLSLSAFQGTDLDTDLIRIVAVSDIAWLSGYNEDEIFRLGELAVRDSNPSNQARNNIAIILEEAFLGPKCDHRPIFSAFYEDFLNELRNPADTSWPNHLRDRLGLYHLNQWAGPLPRRVFLFRYSVREIPRRQGEVDRRPIALPAVLDHRLAEAFCPSPKELRQGQLVNLKASVTDQPAREVLHLFMPLEPKHLFRVGLVTTPVQNYLGPARREHLLWLRSLSGRGDYAMLTDIDLI